MPDARIFAPEYSTNSIWRDDDMTRCLTDDLDAIEADIAALETGKADANHTHDGYAAADHTHDGYASADHSHTEYADVNHTHTDYATATDVAQLQTLVGDTSVSAQITSAVATKADANHTHTEYASTSHSHADYAAVNHEHTDYASTTDLTQLQTLVGDTSVSDQIAAAVATKADSDHTHTEYAEVNHSHDEYAMVAHAHTEYAAVSHEHTGYAAETHSHSEYAAADHTHTEYASNAHNHNYSDLVGTPTSLPAAGGDADTVDGKHASDFAAASDVAQLQTLVGDTSVATQISTAIVDKANTEHTHTISNVTGLTDELDSKYEKPSGGIPKTDLATDVQTSLGKADTAIQSLTGYATESYVDTKVAGIVDSSPEALNTLNELAAALGDDPNFATTVATQIGTKVDKVNGKGLSTNDYTTAEKTKLSGIAEGANKTIVDSALSSTSTNPVQNKVVNSAISDLSDLIGDTSVATQIASAISTKADASHVHDNATTATAGFMSAADKTKLDGISAGATSFSVAKSITLTTEGWYRVATSNAGIKNCLGTFRLNGWRAGYHTSALINAGTNYGTADSSKIGVLHCGTFGDGSILKARLVYHTTYANNYAYLELYVVASEDKTTVLNVEMSNDFGWAMINAIEGSVPDGYSTKEVVLADMAWSDVTATATELNYLDGLTGNVQHQLDNRLHKDGGTMTGNLTINTGATSAIGLVAPNNSDGEQAYSRIYKNASATADYGLQLRDFAHGGPTTNTSSMLMICNNKSTVAERLMFADTVNGTTTYYKLYGEHNKPTLSTLGVTATATELNYVDGVTSNIQTQLNGKAASSHTHKYAGSSSAGGAATSATKLATARTIRTNLGSTSTVSFDGSANVTPGVTGTLPVANGGTGATDAVSARENLGIYVYTGYITTSSSTAANGLLSTYVSAKNLFGFTTVPSNFMIVSATSRSTYFSCNIAHEMGSDSINVKMRNVSGTSVGATNYYYTIVGMLV